MRIFSMQFIRLFAVIMCLMLSPFIMHAQRVDYSSTFRHFNQSKYARVFYENDFFNNTDFYYTQGITFEYANPRLQKFFLSKLLITGKGGNSNYALNYHLFAFTPTSIASDAILYGDRPFAAAMSLELFSITNHREKQYRLSSAFQLGVIGHAALGKEIQVFIHKRTGNPIPKGWQNQIRNDVILNYQVTAEKKLLYADGLLLNAVAEIKTGTSEDRIGAGLNLMLGHFNNPYQSGRKKLSYYVYGQAKALAVGYDATLQGGLFNRSSPYTIAGKDVKRGVFQADAGISINFKKICFGYNHSYISKEFVAGKTHQWGGVQLGISF